MRYGMTKSTSAQSAPSSFRSTLSIRRSSFSSKGSSIAFTASLHWDVGSATSAAITRQAVCDGGGPRRELRVMEIEREASLLERRLGVRVRQWMDLLSAVVMAAATVATAYSAYQSSLWNGEQNAHKSRSTAALVKAGKLSNLAMQRTTVHVNLLVHWLSAINRDDHQAADFLFGRFPEPLRAAAEAWQATRPFENHDAPASPFDMPQYALQERIDADRWEQIAQDESAAADNTGAMSNRYLLFTFIYASVLFLAGISGKFKWPAIDMT